MEKIKIETLEQINEYLNRGLNPFLDAIFDMDIKDRIELQYLYFGGSYGRSNIPKGNIKFYKFVWKWKSHFCEECGKELFKYNSSFISHIITRGSEPRMAWDIRNTNILCFDCHQKYENRTHREAMRIKQRTETITQQLKNEYLKA